MRSLIWTILAVMCVAGAAAQAGEVKDLRHYPKEPKECQDAKDFLESIGINTENMTCSDAIDKAGKIKMAQWAERMRRQQEQERQARAEQEGEAAQDRINRAKVQTDLNNLARSIQERHRKQADRDRKRQDQQQALNQLLKKMQSAAPEIRG